ncbi:unnamed protein product [Rotaria sp. Silwood2]|nr:unnamed protein product [Rotaria sp. Silwood2]CAF3091379.1 unnamed protein product [Rotaria sp. Silwood2]CAF3913363.1 unnamed protein product [Rotaria sp. Silwood2]CAF4470622.1 unnamed protein product [Rotaria sp. Silwood2]
MESSVIEKNVEDVASATTNIHSDNYENTLVNMEDDDILNYLAMIDNVDTEIQRQKQEQQNLINSIAAEECMYNQLKEKKQTDDEMLKNKRKYIDKLVINESQIDVSIELLQDDRKKLEEKISCNKENNVENMSCNQENDIQHLSLELFKHK